MSQIMPLSREERGVVSLALFCCSMSTKAVDIPIGCEFVMAKQGAPIGNRNAAKDRMLSDAIKIALSTDPARVRKIAEQVTKQAADGNLQALSLLLDRLEGKAIQQINQEVTTNAMVVRAPDLARNSTEWSAMYAPENSEDAEDRKPN